MDLHKLISGVIDSSREYWHFMADAPTFHDHLKFFEVYAGQANVLHVTSHHSIAVYIPDVSITMAWGLQWREDFKEPWIENFPDKSSASAGWLDLFFNNALVFRTPYVVVDGGRITLPLPSMLRTMHCTSRKEPAHSSSLWTQWAVAPGLISIRIDRMWNEPGSPLSMRNGPRFPEKKARTTLAAS